MSTEELGGRSWLGGRRAGDGSGRRFHATDPTTATALPPAFLAADDADVSEACASASEAFPILARSSVATRAHLLGAIADGLEARAAALVARAAAETALPAARLEGELARTSHQLRMFASLIQDPAWLDPRVDRGDPDHQPLPLPDVRSLRRPIGPVAVFGASNFPLAFSVAGGDTASALAVGCPVVVKAHPGHPGTSELAGQAIAAAVQTTGLPGGAFSLLFDDGFAVGEALVRDPRVRAVAFTGSRAGGDALRRLAQARPEPIPVYAEMGSVNPVFVLPAAARQRGPQIAAALHASFTLGVGQFCTNPGVVLLPAGPAGDALRDELATRTAATPSGTMLGSGIWSAYERGRAALSGAGARAVAQGEAGANANAAVACLHEADLAAALDAPTLLHEVFGPSTLLLRYEREADLLRFAAAMEGQLTATVHAEPEEHEGLGPLVEALADRVGRILFGGVPTGVAVVPAMVHGGPYPATSDGRSTSVGGRAMERFTRLVAFQDAPEALLPETLRGP